jgi:hypothetical protein
MTAQSPAQVDDVVLAALREIAKDGERRSIKSKTVRLAEPKDGDCVYMRVALEAKKVGAISIDLDNLRVLLSYYRVLEESITRLRNRDLVFNNGGGKVDERTFWVVMS